MGRPPAYIFVVRHGHRLDAADKQWHLSSPTPYDPPLTYGGWMHSRNVGVRIANILRDDLAAQSTAETTADASLSASPSAPRKRRRFRVVVHSSPFNRCVQTSIAISAGLAANPTPSKTTEPAPSRPDNLRLGQASSFSNPAPTKSRPDVEVAGAVGAPVGAPVPTQLPEPHKTALVEKSVLRLDAFLGEWLSPDYFEHITPPPKSALMLATAKAELLRRSSYHDYPHFHHRVHSSTSSHLWGGISGHSHSGDVSTPSATPSAQSASINSPFDSLPNIADSLSNRGSHANGHTNHTETRGSTNGHHHHAQGYVHPVPSYALSPSEPIPRGYVAHARDACASIDYQWDSSRDTIAWGDGGTLPEEWAAMHQRFRRGLRRLVDWYGTTENAGHMVTRTAHAHASEPDHTSNGEHDDDIDVEDVVVLVSHGAGCNALIGAITQQPVLADVAMASLTMAKRRATFDPKGIDLAREKSHSSLATLGSTHVMSRATFPEMYELKLFANTDHLKTPSNAASNRTASMSRPDKDKPRFTSALKEINFGSLYGETSRNRSPNGNRSSSGSLRRSSGGTTPTLSFKPPALDASTTTTTSSSSSGRGGGITVGSGKSSFSVTTRPDRSGSGTWGLWSPRLQEEEAIEEEEPMFLNFSHEKAAPTSNPNPKPSRGSIGSSSPLSPAFSKDKIKEKEKEKKESRHRFELPTFNTHTRSSSKACSETSEPELKPEHHDEEHDDFDEDSVPKLWAGTGSGNGGLWGAPRPPGEAERLRDFSSSKRRWTVTER
ncbi:hypothetical protein F4808DRAFT_434206 [Astrocystis sublimbata]|nr:hypothetical protein F4808DRAFT_434206 [Astrocystis sublimbata]